MQATSPLIIAQSQWIEDDPVPTTSLPLIEPSALVVDTSLDPTGCVIPCSSFRACAVLQGECISRLMKTRWSAPTLSVMAGSPPLVLASSSSSPLSVLAARIVRSESHLLLDKVRTAGQRSFVKTSMSTFFNPYANKNKEEAGGGKHSITLVAEGEERIVEMEFANHLSVPLEVPFCQMKFDSCTGIDTQAPPLSFTIPPKTKGYIVHFPFVIVASRQRVETTSMIDEVTVSEEIGCSDSAFANTFELVGLHVAILNRYHLIPFPTVDTDSHVKVSKFHTRLVPESASIYSRSPHNFKTRETGQLSVQMEAVSAQPNLLVSFKSSQTPLGDEATVPVHLSDGEIYTIPPFRLENDFGPSGFGKMKRIQIVAVGMPGLPEEVLFDTDELAKALEEKEEEENFSDTASDESSHDVFEELMKFDGLPPLKMKCLAEGLSLVSINDRSRSLGEGSEVTFQMAATHDMGNQLANGGNVRIRFRYCGPSPHPSVQIWRKREVSLKIVRVKGPRISSLTFRSDLSWGSSYSELCQSLAHQKKQWENVPKWEKSKFPYQKSDPLFNQMKNDVLICENDKCSDENDIMFRVGMDQGVYVSGSEIVVLMAVINETPSTIVLSNRQRMVGGFQDSPMPTVRVTSGVSVKIPVVIPRIDRIDKNGEVIDIVAELIKRTALQWESEVGEAGDSTNRRIRKGRVRIPSRCLREIINERKSLASRICTPPVTLSIIIRKKEKESELLHFPGYTVNTSVELQIQGMFTVLLFGVLYNN